MSNTAKHIKDHVTEFPEKLVNLPSSPVRMRNIKVPAQIGFGYLATNVTNIPNCKES